MTWKRSIFLLLVCGLSACRGQVSDQPPLMGERNMVEQPKYNPQDPNPMFDDNRAQRPIVAGTVERAALKPDPVFYQGKEADGSWVMRNPRPITRALLLRGQERFNIYCAPCHDRAGTGKGLTLDPKYQAFPPPPKYSDERIRLMPDGQVFDALTAGVRTMPSYRHQIIEADRWAIIAYVRALERSQATSIRDLSPAEIEKLEGKR